MQECDSSIPVASEEIEAARRGEWDVQLTPIKSVPRDWFPKGMDGLNVLCLAAGGGQQVPVLAAAGANVTALELSPEQLEKDAAVAAQHGLSVRTILGDMTELGEFETGSFDLVFNPTSSLFVPNVQPLWEGCCRVLKSGGVLMSGAMNPSFYLFDHEEGLSEGRLEVKYPLPYSDLTSLTAEQRDASKGDRETIEFGHTLEDLIGGQIRCGFQIVGFYEDHWYDSATLFNVYSATSFATRAVKV